MHTNRLIVRLTDLFESTNLCLTSLVVVPHFVCLLPCLHAYLHVCLINCLRTTWSDCFNRDYFKSLDGDYWLHGWALFLTESYLFLVGLICDSLYLGSGPPYFGWTRTQIHHGKWSDCVKSLWIICRIFLLNIYIGWSDCFNYKWWFYHICIFLRASFSWY